MSLRILKGLPLKNYSGVRIGIMANANTSLNFQKALQQYPCDDFNYCHAVGGVCQHQDDVSFCPVRQRILEHTVKMCDSGIFTRKGATLTYDQLFAAYARMDINYGIMIDVLQDSQATLESASSALIAYKPYQDKFNLVGVAQGTTVAEYLDCYARLKQMGFQYVAVGGLLKKTPNTVRYVSVRSEEFMFQVLEEIRRQYPNDWLFALGCFNPCRLMRFGELNVWADSKGWMFRYKKLKLEISDKILERHHRFQMVRKYICDKILTR